MSASEWVMKNMPPPGRHAYMDGSAIRHLLGKLHPELKIALHVERRGDAWRLRISYIDEDGRRVRRGITLPDAGAAALVREYMRSAKNTYDEEKSGKTG